MACETSDAREALCLPSSTRDAPCPLDSLSDAERGRASEANFGKPACEEAVLLVQERPLPVAICTSEHHTAPLASAVPMMHSISSPRSARAL
jgi:hypothetical protein